MRLTRKEIRSILLEAAGDWFLSGDFDFQAAGLGEAHPGASGLGSKRVLWIFDERDPEYNLSDDYLLKLVATDSKFQYGPPAGDTHGMESHALKHYAEFNPGGMMQMCNKIIEYLTFRLPLKIIAADRTGTDKMGQTTSMSEPYFITSGPQRNPGYRQDLEFEPLNEVAEISQARITPGDIINTLDRIQDTIYEDGYDGLSTIEIEIFTNFFAPIADEYDQIRLEVQSAGSQNDVSDANWASQGKLALVEFLKTKPAITFRGIHGGQSKQYFFRVNDAAMSSIPDSTTATLYRYYKVGESELNSLCTTFKWLAPTHISNYQSMKAAQSDMGAVAGKKGVGTEVDYHGGYSLFWEVVADCYFSIRAQDWKEDYDRKIKKQKDEEEKAARLKAQKAAMAGQPVDLNKYSGQVIGKARSGRFTTDQIAQGIATQSGGVCTAQDVYDYLVSKGQKSAKTIQGSHTGDAGTGTGAITEAKIRNLIRKIVRKNIFN